ncbi:unnamed protein product, partial [Urochloa humidicola]
PTAPLLSSQIHRRYSLSSPAGNSLTALLSLPTLQPAESPCSPPQSSDRRVLRSRFIAGLRVAHGGRPAGSGAEGAAPSSSAPGATVGRPFSRARHPLGFGRGTWDLVDAVLENLLRDAPPHSPPARPPRVQAVNDASPRSQTATPPSATLPCPNADILREH